MSVPMKARRTKQEVQIRIGKTKPRMFLVPLARAESVVKQIRKFEITDGDSVPWRVAVQDLLDKYTEPGVMLRGSRAKEGISQTELALKLKIPQSNISEMEHGKRPIGKKMAKRLSKILRIDYRIFL